MKFINKRFHFEYGKDVHATLKFPDEYPDELIEEIITDTEFHLSEVLKNYLQLPGVITNKIEGIFQVSTSWYVVDITYIFTKELQTFKFSIQDWETI